MWLEDFIYRGREAGRLSGIRRHVGRPQTWLGYRSHPFCVFLFALCLPGTDMWHEGLRNEKGGADSLMHSSSAASPHT